MSEITMSARAQKIKERYEQSYVTESQLERYFQLGVITEEEYEAIKAIKRPIDEKEDVLADF